MGLERFRYIKVFVILIEDPRFNHDGDINRNKLNPDAGKSQAIAQEMQEIKLSERASI
jgi:hypothetical protein